MSESPRKSPDLPWKVKLMLDALAFTVDLSYRSNGTINRRLMKLIDFKSSPSKKPVNGVKTIDVTLDKTRKLWFRLYIPTPKKVAEVAGGDVSIPVIFFFHGGGFVYLAANSKCYNDFCRRLAPKLPAVIISVNYRLAPEHPYPCAYEDCFDVLKFIDTTKMEEFPRYANRGNCFLAGDSAGGNVAHHVALKATEHEFKNIKLDGIISLQPFFGGEERTESEMKMVNAPLITAKRTDGMWKLFLPEGSNRDHQVVNIFGPNAIDIAGVNFPATIVFVGGFDALKDWQKRYYEGLKKAGKEVLLIEYPNAIHWFYLFPELRESSLLLEKVKDFVQQQSEANQMR